MHPRSFARSLPLSPTVAFLAFVATLAAPAPGVAQQDTTRTPPRDTLESVVVRAVRGGAAIPTSSSTLDRRTIERTYAGQDAPLALQSLPGVTASSDAGAFSGYSSIRLRGIDQTRLAISVDGVPLSDPEDQVLYLSNIPDFMNSMQSVRLQRGVGSSAFGTSPFAGSLDFESMPIAATSPFAEMQLTGGSWGTQRLSLEGATGLRGPWAAYARLSGHETDGFRHHSGNLARSAFTSVGWFGERDALKFTGFAGRSKMHLAYYAASEAQLAADPRTNPMAPEERDDFWQAMASLQYTRVLRPGTTLTTTAYRNAAGGNYDVYVGTDLWNFNLDHTWHGLLSTLNWSGGGLTYAVGGHVSSYARDHFLFIRPDLSTRIYDNTGHKQEQSLFGKATWTRGPLDLTADMQVRRAAFRYEPTPGSGVAEQERDWFFVNPRVGVSWHASEPLTLFASLGYVSREPTRTDMLAGADDIDGTNEGEILPIERVRSEHLSDLEVGLRLARPRYTLVLNGFFMVFANEILPIGEIGVTGSPLRQNVGRSSRVGGEFEGTVRLTRTLDLSGNLTLTRARISQYFDAEALVTYDDVPPLLTPPILANAQAVWRATERLDLTLGARHVGRSLLRNDGDLDNILPAHSLLDATLGVRLGRHAIRLQAQNLADATAYTAGYSDGVTRYFFPVASRTLLASVTLSF